MPRAASLTPALPALPPMARLLAGLARPLARTLARTVARLDDRHRSRRALSRLDPRLLRDIGLTTTAARIECAKAPWVD